MPLFNLQPEEFVFLNRADIVGDEVERSAGIVGSNGNTLCDQAAEKQRF